MQRHCEAKASRQVVHYGCYGHLQRTAGNCSGRKKGFNVPRDQGGQRKGEDEVSERREGNANDSGTRTAGPYAGPLCNDIRHHHTLLTHSETFSSVTSQTVIQNFHQCISPVTSFPDSQTRPSRKLASRHTSRRCCFRQFRYRPRRSPSHRTSKLSKPPPSSRQSQTQTPCQQRVLSPWPLLCL